MFKTLVFSFIINILTLRVIKKLFLICYYKHCNTTCQLKYFIYWHVVSQCLYSSSTSDFYADTQCRNVYNSSFILDLYADM